MTESCAVKPDCRRLGAAAPGGLVNRYDGRVPRYTSYPTAPNFTAAVGEEDYRSWLVAMDPRKPVSAYVHVPFCERLCWYCGCHTGAAHHYGPVADYVQTFLREIRLVGDALGRKPPLSSLHFGGGTPNSLSSDDLVRVVEALTAVLPFSPGADFAVECDPRTLSEEWIRTAAGLGVNRVSLGVQDLDPHVQAAINRVQPFEQTAWAVESFRAAGVVSVNLDLVYGLPHQTEQGVRDAICRVLELEPSRIALFGYAHVPWMMPRQALIPAEALPGAVERFLQQDAATEELERRGYVRIGLDHFAHPEDSLAEAMRAGTLRRNFQGYTTDTADSLLGFGASSIGRLPAGYVQNTADVTLWRKALEEGRLPVARGVVLTGEDRIRGDIIERLMCELEVDLAEVAARHGRGAEEFAPDLQRLAAFEADGLVTRRGSRITVTARGRPFVRSIASVFDRYFDGTGVRHSRTV